jgi:hypothetical protein
MLQLVSSTNSFGHNQHVVSPNSVEYMQAAINPKVVSTSAYICISNRTNRKEVNAARLQFKVDGN